MRRFLAWLRWEWRSHAKMLVASAGGALIVIWATVLITARGVGTRAAVEGIEVALFAVLALVLGAGLFGSERRSGAAALVLRLPGARVPLFAARLVFFATALGMLALFMAFVAARIAETHVEAIEGATRLPDVGWFLWPRWIIADLAVLALALGCFGALASAWTRRVTLATVLGLFLPALLAFPLFYLSFTRADFYDVRRLGAVPLAAWPLLGLALLALAASWLRGQRFLNRRRRAAGIGVLVLLLGCGLAAAWTASAFATFDTLDPADPGFRLVALRTRSATTHSLNVSQSQALSSDGRYLYAHGLRVDRGTWPARKHESYGRATRDFRADRGTWSKPICIDLQTGEVTVLAGVGGRFMWRDLGRAGTNSWPDIFAGHGWGKRGWFDPKAHAWIEHADGKEAHRLLMLDRPHDVRAPHAGMSDSAADAASLAIRTSTAAVHDAQGRPVWLEFETGRRPWGRSSKPRVVTAQVVAGDGTRRAVDLPPIPWVNAPRSSMWISHGDSWSLRYYPGMVLTLDAKNGAVRTTTRKQLQEAGAVHSSGGARFVLDPSHVLIALAHIDGSPWRYRVLNLETHGVGPVREGPDLPGIVRSVLPNGTLLCRVRSGSREQFEIWDPLADVRTAVATPAGFLDTTVERLHAMLGGTDRRGNMVLTLQRIRGHSAKDLTVQTVLFRIANSELVPLCAERRSILSPAFEAVGIDPQDRVVGLDGFDGHGYLRVVRVDPKDGSRTVLFPRK